MIVAPMIAVARRGRRGFTLVELLVVMIVLAVLAAIVLPKFVTSRQRALETAIKADLKMLRSAVDRFYVDTGCWPYDLDDLAAKSAPARGVDAGGSSVAIDPSDWHGPYVDVVPDDPVAHNDYYYKNFAPGVGSVRSSADGKSYSGTDYASL